MEAIAYKLFQEQLKSSFDRVRNDHKSLMIACDNDEDIIIISKAEYDKMEETCRQFKSPSNETRL
jgi:antitoxin YefM